MRANVLVKELISIVVRDFFPSLDVLDCKDIDATVLEIALAVGSAGVIDVLGSVLLDVAVDHSGVTGPEEVLAAISIALGI